jgi:hypothetical protein
MFFSFPSDARWNPERDAVEFTVGVGEYRGIVHIRRHVFRRFLDGAVTLERCIETHHLQRTRLELVVETQTAPAAAQRGWQCEGHRPRLRGRADRGRDPTGVRRLCENAVAEMLTGVPVARKRATVAL